MSTATKKVAKTQRFEIRVAPELKALTDRAAAIKQVTPSAFATRGFTCSRHDGGRVDRHYSAKPRKSTCFRKCVSKSALTE